MFKKIFIGFLIFFVLLIGVFAAIPFLFKDKINEKIKSEINKQLLADVDYSKFDLSIIRSFPDLRFHLYDLSVVGRNEFEGDTLAKLKEFSFDMDIKSVFKSDVVQVNSIFIDKLSVIAIEYFDEEKQKIVANYHILPETETEEETELEEFKLNLSSLIIKDANILMTNLTDESDIVLYNLNIVSDLKYRTAKTDFNASVFMDSLLLNDKTSKTNLGVLEFVGKGFYTEENAEITSNIKMNELSYLSDKTYLLEKAKVDFKLDAVADLINNIYTLKENELAINNLKVYFDGMLGLKENDGVDIDLTFKADRTSFKDVLSLVPAEYLKDYQGLKAEGTFDLKGFAKGIYNETSMPTFGLDLAVQNGSIQYPDLPTAVEKINLTAKIESPTSDINQLTVNVPKATFTIENEPVELSLFAKNVMTDPYADLKLKGSLDLAKVPQFYPLEGVRKIAGNLNADVAFKGVLSDVENEKYENVDFQGKIDVTNLVYDAVDYPKPLYVRTMDLAFSPKYAALTNFDATFGKSDFKASGRLENFINYALSDGTLKGDLTLNSNFIDLDELMTEESSSTETTESEVIKVPGNIYFSAKMNANQVNYDGLELKAVGGNLTVKDEKVSLDQFTANLLGGSAKINGSYSTKNTDKPIVDFAYNINKFSIQDAFNYVNTVQQIAPIAKYLTGTFSSEMSLSSLLNPDLSLDMKAITGDGEVRIPYATITNLPIFEKITQLINIPALSKPELNDAWTVLKFKDGRVNVDPFDINLKDMKMNIVGSNGFDESIEYLVKLTVPSDKFGGEASIANNFLSKQNIPLLNLAVPQNLTFHLNVDGFLKNPNVKIAKVTADQGEKGIKEQIKDTVKEEIDNAKERAQQELDAQKQKAQQELDAQKQKAQEELNKQKAEAERRAKEEADKLKEDAKNKAKEKLKGFGF
jgi:hypothetical protein